MTGWASEAASDRIVATVYDTASGTVDGDFVLAQTATGAISPPVMIGLPDGGAFVAWYDDALATNSPTMRLHGRFLDGNGAFASAEMDLGSSYIESFDGDATTPLQLAVASDGRVLVSYAADNTSGLDGDRGATVAILVTPPATSGAAEIATVGAEHILDQDTDYEGSASIVHVLGDGRMLAVWMHNPLNDGTGEATGNASVIRGRFLDSNGVPAGNSFDIAAVAAEGEDGLINPVSGVDLDSFTATLTVNGDVLVSFATNDGADFDGGGSSVVSVLVSTQATGGADALRGGAGDDILVGDGQTYGSAVQELDPVAFWRFEANGDDAVDHSGNGHVAVATDGPTGGNGRARRQHGSTTGRRGRPLRRRVRSRLRPCARLRRRLVQCGRSRRRGSDLPPFRRPARGRPADDLHHRRRAHRRALRTGRMAAATRFTLPNRASCSPVRGSISHSCSTKRGPRCSWTADRWVAFPTGSIFPSRDRIGSSVPLVRLRHRATTAC